MGHRIAGFLVVDRWPSLRMGVLQLSPQVTVDSPVFSSLGCLVSPTVCMNQRGVVTPRCMHQQGVMTPHCMH